MLTVQGSRVVGTSSGDGALALVAEWPVDLVLVDDELSGASGIDVARRIREIHPDIPIVLMTAEGGEAVEAAASLAGIVACILKPFEGQALAQLLASLRARAVLAEPAE
jgi:CheY-like chemotaxis protein